MTSKPHHGRNIKRIREIQGIKQEALAIELGEDWNQKKISLLEGKEVVDTHLLQQVAKALHVTPEAIESFDEQAAMNVVSNTFNSHDNSTLNAINHQCSFNPLDELLRSLEENKRLYEALLKEKDEKIALLQKLANK